MPINFNKSFRLSNTGIHYYVFENLFIDYDEALEFCEKNLIPAEFIVKTNYYIN